MKLNEKLCEFLFLLFFIVFEKKGIFLFIIDEFVILFKFL